MPIEFTTPLSADLAWMLTQARARRLRTMRSFAESEIVIPSGPFAGRRFKCERQPFTALFFDAIDTGHYARVVATGPSQSGKTLCGFVIPILYHLFEVGESVVCGLPDLDMAADKWREDLLPVIESSRFKDLLPRQGAGSRGGLRDAVRFSNGATLRFMTGGGSDKSRAGFTSRVLVVSETDGLDRSSEGSRESDKLTQLEARTRAFGRRKRIYLECTLSTEKGRTWQEYLHSTRSRIVLPCPHCHAFVTPERQHLVGWREANTQAEARASSTFVCPDCGSAWSEAERRTANVKARLLHHGQSVNAKQRIEGESPSTDTLGFRWSAVNNLLLEAGDVAVDEWRALRATDEELAERALRQFVWCIPVAPARDSQTPLEAEAIAARLNHLPRGVVPSDATVLTIGIDIGKYLCHWVALAVRPDFTGAVIDYGRLEVPTDSLGLEQGVLVALKQFRETIVEGWPRGTPSGERVRPQLVLIDSGFATSSVYAFCRTANDATVQVMPVVGRGAGQQFMQHYNRPTSTGSIVRYIGHACHAVYLPGEGLQLLESDADHWKSFIHQRLVIPHATQSAWTLFGSTASDHNTFARHLTAERKTEQFLAGRGVVTQWERIRKQNHFLDALHYAAVAASCVGASLLSAETKLTSIGEDDLQPQVNHSQYLHRWRGRY